MDFIPILLIFIPIFFGVIIYLFHKRNINKFIFLSQSIISILFLYYINYFFDSNRVLKHTFGNWVQGIGITIKVDNLSIYFIALTIFLWWIIILFSWFKRKYEFKYLFFILILEGAFIALLISDDLFNIFILLEIISITTTILIIYKRDGFAVKSGLFYLLFNSIAMMFFLISLILLYSITGTLNIEMIALKIDNFNDTNIIIFSYIFMIISLAIKSGVFPAFVWLARANGAAPSSISALLSGIIEAGGIYIYIQLLSIYNMNLFDNIILTIGVFTSLSAGIMAICHKDIKQILALSTISQIGLIFIGLSNITEYMYIGALAHIFNHAIFKTLLFLVAGIIINRYNSRDITKIRGVFKESPIVSIFFIIGLLSISGAPFFSGFITKTIMEYGASSRLILKTIIKIINFITLLYSIKLIQIFFGTSKVNKLNMKLSNISIFILVFILILIGILGVNIIENIFRVDLNDIEFFTLNNVIYYLISFLLGGAFYKLFLKDDNKIFRKIRNYNLSFENTNTISLVTVVFMIIWVWVF
ncbi:complex I subunit 5 family protein [Senegalia massiliensis]|uniref:complex I subunit 5 family protein n=1 Tax=Senegalia massiliensis TaxID=1720316 RepID=UPI0010304480|nr:proton-conducting transporter membrane subunit [Senegalia massiliensis]